MIKKSSLFYYYLYFIRPRLDYAERTGFEPVIRFRRIHAFQACLFNHSSISPSLIFYKGGRKLQIKKEKQAISSHKYILFLKVYNFYYLKRLIKKDFMTFKNTS